MKQVITTNNAPGAIGPYSQGIIVNEMIYTSGQLPIDVKTGEMPNDISAQTKQSLENVKAILEEAGSSMANIIKATVFLSEMENFKAMNDVYQTFFEDDYPARSAFEVARLPKDALVEIEVIAII
ncbi:MAG: RidA family protein [Clostridium sp.]|jgi:2-iminobutanoate/2-iminopropanoate deaminase|nr:RidA family protein [Clostridium sp.]